MKMHALMIAVALAAGSALATAQTSPTATPNLPRDNAPASASAGGDTTPAPKVHKKKAKKKQAAKHARSEMGHDQAADAASEQHQAASDMAGARDAEHPHGVRARWHAFVERHHGNTTQMGAGPTGPQIAEAARQGRMDQAYGSWQQRSH